MKAVLLERYGTDYEVLALRDAPDPRCGPTDVLVDVHAAGFNPFECKLRKGWLQRFYPFAFPHVLGNDFAGVVVEKGPAVFGLQVGDRVYGMQDTMRWGSYAERIAVAAANVRPMPSNLTFEQAASLPMVYQTAWMGLVDMALTRPGELVLVQAGAGGVGSAAVQLARALGAHVAATCSTDAVEFVRGLGASVVVDYRTQDFTKVLNNVDVVFDPIGGRTNLDSYRTMRRGGRICVVLREDKLEMENSSRLCAEHGVTRHVVAFEQRADVLDYIRPLFESGQLKPVVTKVLPLANAADAHRGSDAGSARGKVVLKVR
jgi:NADPH:quinone reductase-like Zn-dependent oxidoreductase